MDVEFVLEESGYPSDAGGELLVSRPLETPGGSHKNSGPEDQQNQGYQGSKPECEPGSNGDVHCSLSGVSLYPNPRTVCMSRFSNPLSTFERSGFMQASTALFSTFPPYPQTALIITSRRRTACRLR